MNFPLDPGSMGVMDRERNGVLFLMTWVESAGFFCFRFDVSIPRIVFGVVLLFTLPFYLFSYVSRVAHKIVMSA